ncbi:chromate transporter [Anaerosphaera multitolerans]|uniref:Chromate transporter n=1 Tax=Anaerosphaera multitolerans TaxID=2487351 RepID=A0A437SA20_9FIRM|nr:chromate transporter [Anaerosphaera multitolerans]RVU55731.1 chromate transporter [Anaerosphaera multitolerans]
MKRISLSKLFFTFFKINALTFGGGYTIVPIVKDVFVNDLNLIDNNEMTDLIALAQSGPGAMAISTSILTGYKLRGPIGAIVCLIASTLPCLLILSLVSVFYTQFKTNFFIKSALDGISGIICAVLLITVFNMGKAAYKSYPVFSSVLMVLTFILGFFMKISTAPLLLFSALMGVSVFFILDRRDKIE